MTLPHPISPTGLKVLAAALCSAFLASCGGQQSVTRLSDAEVCETLQYIKSQASDNFAAIRTRKVIHPEVDIWESKKIFPDSKQCQIWSWSQGLTNYACVWQEKNEADARGTFDKYTPVVAECLGSEWTGTERTTKNGKQMLFRKVGDKTAVSMRYFEDTRALIPGWWTSFIIGPEIKTYDPLQRYDAE